MTDEKVRLCHRKMNIGKWLDENFITITGVVWIGGWVLSIWVSQYSQELFWTGSFALALGLLATEGKNRSQSSGEKANES